MSKANMKLIITFDTTMDSIAFEKACKPYDLGRLIPTPQIISAGCGFSWCMNEEDKEKILDIIEKEKLEYASMKVIEL
jgi:hypothetical protein